MKHSFRSLLALALLTSCSAVGDIVNPADILLDAAVKDWLHEQNGQVLTFRNAAGTTQTLYVRRRDETTTGAAAKAPSAQIKLESTTLVYSRLPANRTGLPVRRRRHLPASVSPCRSHISSRTHRSHPRRQYQLRLLW